MLSLSTKKNINSLSRSKNGTIICVITDVRRHYLCVNYTSTIRKVKATDDHN